MKCSRTYKLKITTENQRFLEVAKAYQEAANWLSKIIFNRKYTQTPATLSKEFYGTVREKFKLPSQVTCSLFRHVVSTYRSMKSNKEWSLATYKNLFVPICWKRDFNLSSKGLSLWSIPIQYKSQKLPVGQWSDSKLKLIGKYWYLCLTIEIDIPENKAEGTIIGVDSGIKNIFTAYDKKSNKTLYIKGKSLNHKRLRIRQIKAKVASVGTQSAKRLLKRLSGKEKSVTRELLHLASKQVVAFAESVGARSIAMEDLKGIRKSSRKPQAGQKPKQSKKQRANNNRWPFAQAQFYIQYKAANKGIGFELVPPKNTSRSCPICGHTAEANRKGLVFRCIACEYQDNADRVGAMNIASRSIFQRQAVEERAVYQPAYSNDEGVAPVNYKPNHL